MDYEAVIAERHSVRSFTPQPVEEEKIRKILLAANMAPSAGNLQSYEIFLVTDANVRQELSRAAYSQPFVASAHAVLVFCSNPVRASARYGDRGERLYAVQDATIACTLAMLSATSEGLATTWVGAFDDHAVHACIGSPQGLQPVAILPIGYPAETPGSTPRRKLADLIHVI